MQLTPEENVWLLMYLLYIQDFINSSILVFIRSSSQYPHYKILL